MDGLRLGRAFERACRSQNPRHQCSYSAAKTPNCNWVAKPKRHNTCCTDKEKVFYDHLPNPEIESLGFEWEACINAWKTVSASLPTITNPRHRNVPKSYSENKLAKWVGNQRFQYRLHPEGKTSSMIPYPGIGSLGFEWNTNLPPGRPLSELADYQKATGTAMSLQVQSENTNLVRGSETKRLQYRLHLKGKKSSAPRIQELESLGFEWDSRDATWEDRLSELADYRKIHGHCNVLKLQRNSQAG
jgi:hypothetical protein